MSSDDDTSLTTHLLRVGYGLGFITLTVGGSGLLFYIGVPNVVELAMQAVVGVGILLLVSYVIGLLLEDIGGGDVE